MVEVGIALAVMGLLKELGQGFVSDGVVGSRDR